MIVNGIQVPAPAIRLVQHYLDTEKGEFRLWVIRAKVEAIHGRDAERYSGRLCDRLFQKYRKDGKIRHLGGGRWERCIKEGKAWLQ